MLVLSVVPLMSPLLFGVAIGSSAPARAFIARRYRLCLGAGWAAILLAIPAAVTLDGGERVAALALLCPLMSLAVWRRSGGEGGDDGASGSDDRGPLPQPPSIDWAAFMRDLDEYAASRGSRV